MRGFLLSVNDIDFYAVPFYDFIGVKNMFRHLLLPVDFTEKCKPALDVALEFARQYRAMVTLLHVIETIPNSDTGEFDEFYKKLEETARGKLEKMSEVFSEKGVGGVRNEIVFGHRVEEIVRYANENNMDLMILASHRMDLKHPAEGWGTISHKVGILSQCPVLLVK